MGSIGTLFHRFISHVLSLAFLSCGAAFATFEGQILIKMQPGKIPQNLPAAVTSITSIFGSETHSSLRGYFAVQFKGSAEILLNKLRHLGGVNSISPDYYLSDPSEPSSEKAINPHWYLERIGISKAWEIATGKDMKIADVESGWDTKHPDLEKQFDLSRSWDYDPQSTNPSNIRDGKTTHGTMVASVVAAENNDRFGTGIAYDAQLIGSQMAIAANWSSSAAKAILGSVEQGADVILVQKQVPLLRSSVESVPIIRDAILYAIEQGIPVVLPAGNFATELVEEARLPDTGAIVVGASSFDDKKVESSNFGKRVDVYAPGESIYAARPNESETDAFGGTSAAAAMVAGVVALIREKDPSLDPRAIRKLLIENSRRGKLEPLPLLNAGRSLEGATGG